MDLHITKRCGPRDSGRYVRLPIDVPVDVERMQISYAYRRGAGARRNVVDIGLLDDAGRVRGWSGSARRKVFVSSAAATPGYRAGPIGQGRWAVVLGLYKIHESLEIRIVVQFSRKRRVLLSGDFHLHTFHSDGTDSPAEMMAECEKAGLDVIALTDHNSTEQNLDVPRSGKLVVLSGMEYTNYRGHASFLFPEEHARFDEDPFSNGFPEMARLFEKARGRGAVICINHPLNDDCPWTFGWEGFPFDLVEVWNGPMKDSEMKAITWWHERLAQGARIAAIGGSDTHRPDSTAYRGAESTVYRGGPTTCLTAASRARTDILDALRAGRSFITYAPEGPLLDLAVGDAHTGDCAAAARVDLPGAVACKRVRRGDRVRVLDRARTQEWRVPRSGPFSARFRAHPEAGFYRVEVWRELSRGTLTLMALSNPVYVKTGIEGYERTPRSL